MILRENARDTLATLATTALSQHPMGQAFAPMVRYQIETALKSKSDEEVLEMLFRMKSSFEELIEIVTYERPAENRE
jgi:hypothetical protein